MVTMNENTCKLTFGVAFAFLFAVVVFGVGVFWNKLTGGWQNKKLRNGWITFCLVLPFIALGMMWFRMSEDRFYEIRTVWDSSPFLLIVFGAVVLLLGSILLFSLVRLWRTPSR